MPKLILVALGLGIVVLLVGLFFPGLISAPDNDLIGGLTLNEGNSSDLNDAIRVTLDDVNATEGTANVTLRDTETQETAQTTVSESENETVGLSGETITVTLESIDSDSSALLSVAYPATFGWSPGAVLFADNLDVVLAGLAFIVFAGFLVFGLGGIS